MGNKKTAEAVQEPEEQYINESVIPTEEDLVHDFIPYTFYVSDVMENEELSHRSRAVKERRFFDLCAKGFTVREANTAQKQEIDNAPVYKRFGVETAGAIEDSLREVRYARTTSFLASREPRLRAAILPYIEDNFALLWSMGYGDGTFWRAVNYGLSISSYEWDKEAGYNRYTPVSELSQKDREAVRAVALDTYYTALDTLSFLRFKEVLIGLKEDAFFEEQLKAIDDTGALIFKPYPMKGYSKTEIAEQRSIFDNKYTEEKLYETCEFEVELYLPQILHRLDTAIFYAFRYPGNEYETYLRSLDVKSDWGFEDDKEKKTGAAGYDTIVARYKK